MADLDELLRRSLDEAGASWHPSNADVQEQFMKRYRRRRVARATASGALVAAAVVGVLVLVKPFGRNTQIGSAQSPTPTPGASTVVPWVSTPPSAPPKTEPTVQPASAGVPDCKSSQLQARMFEAMGAAAGHVGNQIILANVSPDECTLHGYPRLYLKTTHGGDPAQINGSFFPDSGDIRVDLKPNSSVPANNEQLSSRYAQVLFEWQDCKNENQIGQLTITPEGEPPIVVDLAAQASKSQQGACGSSPQPAPEVFVNRFDGFPEVPSKPEWTKLTATVEAPASAQRGSELRYTVTLANQTSSDIALDPCMAYDEFVASPKPLQIEHYQLNCGGAGGVVRAGSSVVFEMVIQVPATQPTGTASLQWTDRDYRLVSDAATIEVT